MIEEEKQRKDLEKQKQFATIEKCERIKEYASKVQEEHAPRIKTK